MTKSEGIGYPQCTNSTYSGLWEKDAAVLKREKSKGGIVVKELRDHLDTDELVTVMFAEVAAKKDIEKNDYQGNKDCADSCYRTAKKVAEVLK